MTALETMPRNLLEGLPSHTDEWSDDFLRRTPSPAPPMPQPELSQRADAVPFLPPRYSSTDRTPVSSRQGTMDSIHAPPPPSRHAPKDASSRKAKVPVRDSEDLEVAIAIMGATGSGKTTFINTVSGSHLKISGGLRSCTNVVQTAPPLVLDGKVVTLIDTPGFDDTTKSDTDILKMIAQFLSITYENGKKLAGVIYIHRISDFRMGGISTRNFKMFRQLCGDSSLKNVVILTNMWGEVGKEVGEARERELMGDDLFFKPVLEKGAAMVRHDATLASAHRVLRYLIHKDPAVLQIVDEISIQKKDILQTAAGEELNRALLEQMKKHKAEMAELQEEWRAALEAKDEETKQELEREARKLKEAMSRIESESAKLASDFQKEREELEKRMQAMDEEAKREQKRLQEEYSRRIDELVKQRDNDTTLSEEKQAALTRQIEELKLKAKSGGWFANIGRAIDKLFGIS